MPVSNHTIQQKRILDLRDKESFFEAYPFRYNPFGPLDEREMTRSLAPHPQFGNWLKAIENSKFLLVLYGPGGSGKTAHLRAFKQIVPESTLYFADGPDAAFPFEEGKPILIDNFETLGAQTRNYLLTLKSPIIAASRKAFRWNLRNSDRQKEFVKMTTPDPEGVREMIHQRLALASSAVIARKFTPDVATCRQLTRRYRGNTGRMVQALYLQYHRAMQESDLVIA